MNTCPVWNTKAVMWNQSLSDGNGNSEKQHNAGNRLCGTQMIAVSLPAKNDKHTRMYSSYKPYWRVLADTYVRMPRKRYG